MPEISPNKPYRIGRSKTGLGLFATKPIKKGTKIIRYFGPLLDSRKKEDEEVDNKYLFEINSRWTIDGSVRKNIARYINHSCKPNAESDVNSRKRRVIIRAIKNIEVGEEINYDYGSDYFKIFLKPIGCKCDSCEKKRAKKRAEERAEKLRLKKKAEKKAAKAAEKAQRKAEKARKKADKAEAKAAKAKTRNKAKKADVVKAKASKTVANAHARGTGKPSKTKASRSTPAAGAVKSRQRKRAAAG